MKILLLNDSLAAGGAQRQFVGLAVLLRQAGYEVIVCTYHDLNFFKDELVNNNVEFCVIPGAADKKRRIFSIFKYLKEQRPECVIAFQESPSVVACVEKLMGLKFRLIVSERRTRHENSLRTKFVYWLFRQADVIVPNSHSQEQWIIKHQPRFRSKVVTITNFVDLNRFSFIQRRKSEVPRIIVAATVSEVKNVDRFLDTVSILKNRNVVFQVDWYGLNPEETVYQKMCVEKCASLGLSDVFAFRPKTKTIEVEYRNADFFCLPSLSEGCSNAICEAISTGLPVVCSRVGDNPFLVKDGYNGHLFDPLSVDDIADKIEQIVNLTPEYYDQYRKNSREHAEEILGKKLFIESYKSIINDTK